MHLFQRKQLIMESEKLISLVFKEFLMYVTHEKYIEFYALKESALSLHLNIEIADSTDRIAQKMINLNIANACLNDFKLYLINCVDMGYIKEPQLTLYFNCLDSIVELLGIYRRSIKQNLVKWEVHYDRQGNKVELHQNKASKGYSKQSEEHTEEEELLGAAENTVSPPLFSQHQNKVEEQLIDTPIPPLSTYIDNLVNKWKEEIAVNQQSAIDDVEETAIRKEEDSANKCSRESGSKKAS